MNYTQILKRAWTILWSYRALWIFGMLVALTSAPNGGNNGNGVQYQLSPKDSLFTPPAELRSQFDRFNDLIRQWSNQETGTVIAIILAFVGAVLLLAILFTILRYISQVALIRMVDRYEGSGEKLTFRQGFRLGWSRPAWRLFLVNLVIFLPLALVLIALFGCAALPVLLGSMAGGVPTWAGIVATIGLGFLVIFLAILVGVALSLVTEMIYRVVVFQETGVVESIRLGIQTVRRSLKDVFVVWLILVGIQLGFFVILIPVVLVFGGVALLVGGGLGISVYFLAQAISSQVAGWVSGAIVGISLFLLVFLLPLLFMGGLKETYLSTVWTLTYRELSRSAALSLPVQADAPASES